MVVVQLDGEERRVLFSEYRYLSIPDEKYPVIFHTMLLL
jgi:hypothetical protein